MTWFLAGSAVLTVASTAISGNAAGNAATRNANATSKAEGEAIAKERLNTTVRNSYQAAFSQMQLGLRKKQLAQQGAGITATALAARGDVTLGNAATGSIGSSAQVVLSDIDMKAQAALDMTTDAYESAAEQHNTNLNMMVLNTEQSATAPREIRDVGPSSGEMLGAAVLGGVAQFAAGYAGKKMSLGLGKPIAASNVSSMNTMSMGYNPSSSVALGNTSSFFNTRF